MAFCVQFLGFPGAQLHVRPNISSPAVMRRPIPFSIAQVTFLPVFHTRLRVCIIAASIEDCKGRYLAWCFLAPLPPLQPLTSVCRVIPRVLWSLLFLVLLLQVLHSAQVDRKEFEVRVF